MTYEEHRATLIAYLKAKVEQSDWHGAADACCDLRELEAEERGRQCMKSIQPVGLPASSFVTVASLSASQNLRDLNPGVKIPD